MATLTHPFLRKLLSVGTGLGIVAGERDLDLMIVRARPGGPRLVGAAHVELFRSRPPSEWGAEVARFLSSHEAQRLAAVVVLARSEVVVRSLTLGPLSEADTAAAVRYQLDTLHPWGDDEVVFDCQRLDASQVLVAVARRDVVDSYTALFAEAGLKLAGFTFSGSAVFRSLRLLGRVPPAGILAAAGLDAGLEPPVEIYGESASRPLFSAEFDLPADRAAALSRAELRLEDEVELRDWADLLPMPAGEPAPTEEEQDQARRQRSLCAPLYSAALAAACPHLGTTLNLLPPEHRAGSSRAVYIPTVVLVVLLVLLGSALLAESSWLDRRYLARLEAETQRLAPAQKEVDAVDRQTAVMADRIRLIDDFRRRSQQDLDLLLELNKLMPPPTWLQQLTIDRQHVVISGETERAEALLKVLDASPLLMGTEFAAPTTRGQEGEMFRLRSRRRGAKP
jgi:Tfp pilus assembly protein PilN